MNIDAGNVLKYSCLCSHTAERNDGSYYMLQVKSGTLLKKEISRLAKRRLEIQGTWCIKWGHGTHSVGMVAGWHVFLLHKQVEHTSAISGKSGSHHHHMIHAPRALVGGRVRISPTATSRPAYPCSEVFDVDVDRAMRCMAIMPPIAFLNFLRALLNSLRFSSVLSSRTVGVVSPFTHGCCNA
eukprot:scpid46781/ scgid9842/ 